MNFSKYFFATGLALSISAGVVGQTPRRRTITRPAPARAVTPQPAPEPVNRSLPSRELRSPIALAIVNGQTITTADIDPRVREEVESLEERITDTRRRVLDLQINTELLEIEAKKRKVTSQQLYNLEVSKRVPNPTDAEIKKFIEDNRDQIEQTDETSLRQQVISLLRATQEAKVSEEFVGRLRTANPVIMGVDINSPNLNPGAVLATVGGQPITAGVIIERLKPAIYKVRISVFEMESEALERTINDLLLIAEANRRNVPPEEIVRAEISDKSHPPTEAEVAKFYAENKTRIGKDLNSVRNQLAEYLQEQGRQQLERAMSEKLRKGAQVRLLISEPQPPTQAISTDDDPSRGGATAPVTIVEFTDFQCPSCAAMHPVLEEVLKSYGNKVRLVIRDFPLATHANAHKAAEAANAAHAQGKFFEYAALLFKRQDGLDIPSLKKYASELGLDRARFDAALDGGTFAAEVRRDIVDGEMYGIDSTPTIFVNGVFLKNLSAEDLRAAIDRALGATSTPKTPTN
ncbi:MAG: thioredoxin domain-containing protein [Acidobacteriota bacterium]|nr:thioredoxin domain-containing protein [Acidobacteriota bacterium]